MTRAPAVGNVTDLRQVLDPCGDEHPAIPNRHGSIAVPTGCPTCGSPVNGCVIVYAHRGGPAQQVASFYSPFPLATSPRIPGFGTDDGWEDLSQGCGTEGDWL